jgi:hypothetical protein
MICHVCEQPAIGQCKSCGKFYCQQHGDVYCVRCATATRPEGQKLEREFEYRVGLPDDRPATEAEANVLAALHCHYCRASVTGACVSCGRFYCFAHGAEPSFFARPGLCTSCHEGVKLRGQVGCFVVVAVFIICILAAILSSLS